MLFPLAEYWWFYAVFTAFVLVLLAIDLGVFHRKDHEITIREAAKFSAIWISMAMLFNVLLYYYALSTFSQDQRLLATPGFNPAQAASQVALEFLAGYVVEYTLSVDNMFVFVVIFTFFRVPSAYQHRVLFYGILGALIFRAIFIALGAVLLSYHWVIILFGVLLIYTGIKMLSHSSESMDPSTNPLVRLTHKVMPVSDRFDGHNFFSRIAGRWHATPLFLALMAIEMSDIVFAIDSVPAIFALTREPLIVFTSNVFAILGLRSLYFVLAGAVARFTLLRFGLAGVLMFIGLKMIWLNQAWGGHFPISWSLAIIGTLVGGSIVASVLVERRKQATLSERDG